MLLAFRELLCYVEAAGCRKPTNKAYAGRAVLLMQPAPLTGTATTSRSGNRSSKRDAARTPHGDGNFFLTLYFMVILQDAARTPHGDKKIGHRNRFGFLCPVLLLFAFV